MADAYPYLRLANKLGVDYGDVLWFATYHERCLGRGTPDLTKHAHWIVRADQRLTIEEKAAIKEVVRIELDRRA